MKTTLSTKTSLFHIIISIVVAGLLFSVNLTMAENSSTSPSDEKVKKEILKKKELAEKKEIQEKKKIYEKNKKLKEKKIMEKKEFTSDSMLWKLIEKSPDGCTLIVEHPEFSGKKYDPSKGLVMKSVNPNELKITAKKVAAHRTKDEMKYIGDVTITTTDFVINTEEADAISENQKLIIKMGSAKIKKLRS